jgi:uncharacterized protein (DUF1778 family)
MKWIELLKSVYNRQGKIQGSFNQQGTKTEHIPINSMVLLCGQDLPTLDVALLDRCICLTSYKTEFSYEEKNQYKRLKEMEEAGLVHITDELIKHRDFVIENFELANNILVKMISEQAENVSGRIQKSLATILTPAYILREKGLIPFSLEHALAHGINIIKEQQTFISSSDDLRSFWTVFQTLLEQKRIKEGRNYKLHSVLHLTFRNSEEETKFENGKKVLFLRWEGLYPLYAEYARRTGFSVLSEKTVGFYLEKTKYFLGKLKSKMFYDPQTQERFVNQALCFDYELMNLELNSSEEPENNSSDELENNNEVELTPNGQKDLPF